MRADSSRSACPSTADSSLENLKAGRSYEWAWLTRLKRDQQVNPDGTGNRLLKQCDIAETGSQVHLRGYGSYASSG